MSRLLDVLLQGLAADRPAASDVVKGSLYFSTDTEIIEQSDGSSWSPYSGPGGSGINQLTGDVTAGPGNGSQAATIANDAVTNAKLANMAASRIKGRITSTGDPQDLTPAQATAILDNLVGDSGLGGVKGLAPAPGAGDGAADKFLKADGTWSVPAISGGGITALTGDVTAGPGSGSQVATLANSGVAAGSYTSADITVDAKGRITAAANGSSGGSPGGLNTQVQFNDSSVFGGSADFVFDKSAKVLTVTNGIAVTLGGTPASTGGFRLPNNTAIISRDAGGSGNIVVCYVDAADIVRLGNTGNNLRATGLSRTATFVIDGAGATITTGVKGDLRIPIACTIVKATLLADQSGSIVVNIWKDSYANYPPTVADKITASAPPTISSADKSEDSTLTGWTTTINAGDTLRINVDSATTIQRVTLILDMREN